MSNFVKIGKSVGKDSMADTDTGNWRGDVTTLFFFHLQK
jgi:hypothetical protein